MKTTILYSIVFALLLVGCKKETQVKTVPVAQETVPVTDEIKMECYIYNQNGSAISLQVDHSENAISGRLTIGLKEKDLNTGIFEGKIENNILIADYKFQSEGTESTRQVAIQFKDGHAYMGYGEMNEDGTKFKDVSQLKFDSTMPLDKTECAK